MSVSRHVQPCRQSRGQTSRRRHAIPCPAAVRRGLTPTERRALLRAAAAWVVVRGTAADAAACGSGLGRGRELPRVGVTAHLQARDVVGDADACDDEDYGVGEVSHRLPELVHEMDHLRAIGWRAALPGWRCAGVAGATGQGGGRRLRVHGWGDGLPE
eukprot:4302587-Prymnesium_polylepis.2